MVAIRRAVTLLHVGEHLVLPENVLFKIQKAAQGRPVQKQHRWSDLQLDAHRVRFQGRRVEFLSISL